MARNSAPRVAVVGGGIAGLVAAWELAQHGVEVHLYERDEVLGGRIHSAEILGEHYDVGAEAFATRGGGVEQLLSELGLADEIERPADLKSWIVHPDLAAPLPPTGMLGIPVSPLKAEARRILGWAGAARAAMEPWLPRQYGGRAENIADLVRTRFGSRVLTRLVAPVVRGVYSSGPAHLPVTAVPGLAKTLQTSRSLTEAARKQHESVQAAGPAVAGLRGGMGTLISELMRQLQHRNVTIHWQEAVTEIVETTEGLRLHAECAAEPGEAVKPLIVSAAVVTVPGVRVELAATEPAAQGGDGGLGDGGDVRDVKAQPASATVEVVALLIDAPSLGAFPRGTGALVAAEAHEADQQIRAKALTHSSAKWRWLAEKLPHDRHLIRLSYGEHGTAPGEPRFAPTTALNDGDARRLACRDASRILGIEIRETQVVGFARKRHTLPPRGASANTFPASSGVFAAGEWSSGTGLASVIPAARAAARDCRAHLFRELNDDTTRYAATTEEASA